MFTVSWKIWLISNKRLHDAEKEISILQNEVQVLKTENQRLKEQAVKIQEEFKTTESRFDEIEGNFTKVSFRCAKYERVLNKKLDDFEKNTSTILNDIKIEVRYLFVTLLDLNKHTMEINESIPNLIESKFTEYSTIVKRSVSDINNKLLTSTDFQEQLVHNLSTFGNDQSSLMKIISGILWKQFLKKDDFFLNEIIYVSTYLLYNSFYLNLVYIITY